MNNLLVFLGENTAVVRPWCFTIGKIIERWYFTIYFTIIFKYLTIISHRDILLSYGYTTKN